MRSCGTIQTELTAWIDGELSPRQADRVQQHVATCAACAAEVDSLRRAIGMQRRALPEVTAVSRIEPDLLWLQLQRALHEPAEERLSVRNRLADWLLRPVVLASSAVAAAAVILALVFAGGPAAVLVPLGVQSPPVAVKANPELFKDYPLIQHLDALENFDTVQSVPLDDDQTGQG